MPINRKAVLDLLAELPPPAPSQVTPDPPAKHALVGTKPNDPHRNDPRFKKRRREGAHRGWTRTR